MTIRFIDLFAGVGGFHYGISRVNTARQEQDSVPNSTNIKNKIVGDTQSFSCVYSNEWDKYANSVYRKHFGECDDRDIRTVPTSDIPDHDLLVGGFPCQAFSVAGKRGGFDDTRGTLFFEIARILRDKRPRYLLLENVKGLLSHDSGKTFQTILGVLSDIGYGVQWQVLNSKDFGVPQNRERVYIVGHLRGTSRPEVFPIREGEQESDGALGLQSVRQVAGTLRATDYKGTHNNIGEIIQLNNPVHSNNRVYGAGGISPTLNTAQGGNRQPKIEAEYRIRRLTPIECERLQGFPDNWTEFGADGEKISDTQRYKMMGNAVTTNVITEIVLRLF